MVNSTGFLNCYERDELEQWLDDVEDLAYDDDDEFIKQTFYPDEY
jgi:hypothetical protein